MDRLDQSSSGMSSVHSRRGIGGDSSPVIPSGGSHTSKRVTVGQRQAYTLSRGALMTRTAVSIRLIAGAPVALVDDARAERPGLDQVERDVVGDRRQERRAATDDDRIAEHAQL